MSIWPIEEEPLKPGEVRVTHEQFGKIGELARLQELGLISDEEYADRCIGICPRLTRGQTNRLVVTSPRSCRLRICF